MRTLRISSGSVGAAIAGLLCAASAAAAQEPAGALGWAPGNFEIAGVSLQSSGVGELTRRLGRGEAKPLRHIEEAYRCYASVGTDGTILEFYSWLEDLAEFRLYRGAAGVRERCQHSAAISRDLRTSSGLRLDMEPDQVLAILGRPTAQSRRRLTYEVTIDRPPTDGETARFRRSGYNPPAALRIYERIDVFFHAGKVARLDVRFGEDW